MSFPDNGTSARINPSRLPTSKRPWLLEIESRFGFATSNYRFVGLSSKIGTHASQGSGRPSTGTVDSSAGSTESAQQSIRGVMPRRPARGFARAAYFAVGLADPFVRGVWRRARDSNPRYGCPYT
jgi:hypothetical protein